jgi:hypothetical protein
MKYTIDLNKFDEGGSAEFYNIKENKNLGFKQFRNKRSATNSYNKQKLLSKYGLAPKVHGKVCKLEIEVTVGGYGDYSYTDHTNWGYVTEKAKILDENVMKKRLRDIQNLVETIENKTRLRFWDCHYWNVGYVKRNNKAKLVCIDTGAESFDRNADAWGMGTPGPKCGYCSRYQCRCSDAYWRD